MGALDWLTTRPIAHRGLHDAAAGTIENTASAFTAAIDGTYGIECDLQVSADGEAMVHHDDALGRLTEGAGALASLSAAAIKAVRFKATADRILTLGELCDLVAGRTTLVLELKRGPGGDRRLAARVAQVLAGARGPVAAMSFDPDLIEPLRHAAPNLPRGLVAERRNALLRPSLRARPQFLAYAVKDLPDVRPLLARNLFGLPLLTWTVREANDVRTADRWADQMIFEGWRP
jgi:glycerophosphoryl diester phosphodiesterase